MLAVAGADRGRVAQVSPHPGKRLVAVEQDAVGAPELGPRGQHEAQSAGPARRRDSVRGRAGAPVVAHPVPVRRESELLLGLLPHPELELREHVRAGERRPPP